MSESRWKGKIGISEKSEGRRKDDAEKSRTRG